ncbi:MAG: carboxypeptidase regulatory-like domain-containing protein [bacterium]
MRMKLWGTPLVLAAALTIIPAAPASAYKAGEVKGGGSISGVIKFDGEAPKPKKFSVNKDKKVCGKKDIFSETLSVKDGGVQWAVVSLKGVESGKEWGGLSKAVIDQKGCIYKAHITVMKAGSRLLVKNSDKILHNVHTYPGKTKNPTANIAQPKFKKKLKMKKRYFKKAGIVGLKCDVHDWMNGYVVVADSPYSVVSGEGGKFKLTDVPAGSYTLEVWHETLGTKSVEVTVKGGADAEVDVTFEK